MSELNIFNYQSQEVRTVLVDGEPWFVAIDVTNALGFVNGRMAVSRLDEADVSQTDIRSGGQMRKFTIINEPALYELIMRSDKPEARVFRRWVTKEVLPQIRRTGQFGSQLPSNFAEALELAAAKVRELEAAEEALALAQPKIAAYDQLMDSEGYYTMEAAAKLGGIGRTTFFNRLREVGVIQRTSRLPYQQYLHWFKITTSSWKDSSGFIHNTETARVRPDFLTRVLAKAGVEIVEAA